MAGNIGRSTRLTRARQNQAVGDTANEPGESRTQNLKSLKRVHETDSEDDLDEKLRKKRAKTRAKKKDQSKAVGLAKPTKKRGASLSMLVDQPLDIILTICQFTANPRDFVSLMQVNRAFYNLLSSHAIATWTVMRAEFEIPDRLPGMSEAEWAILLLGEPICEECGRRNKHHVHPIFMFKKRLCGTCLKNRTLKAVDVPRKYPKNHRDIFDLVPHLEVGAQRYNRYYSREEVEKVAKDLERLKLRPKKERLTYMASGKIYCKERISFYYRVKRWIQQYRWIEEDELCAIRAKAIQERFVQLGYCNEDAEIASKSHRLREPKELNDREWNLVKERALQVMDDHRLESLISNPARGTFARRRELVPDAYTQLKKSLAPGRWLRAPTLEAIYMLPEVLKILILPDTVVCTPEDFLGALELCRPLIEGWSDRVDVSGRVFNKEINKIAKNAFGPNFTGEYPEMPLDPVSSSCPWPGLANDCDKLAIFGFRCNRCPRWNQSTCTSFDVAFGHSKCYKLAQGAALECPRRPWIELEGPHYVHIQLLYLSGMKIATATVNDMDNRGDFFRCLDCAASPDPARQGRSVVTWRECIVKHCHVDHFEPGEIKFELVHEEVEDIRKYWACAHCNVHVDALVTRGEVHQHLLDVHSISDPSVPGDFLYAGPY